MENTDLLSAFNEAFSKLKINQGARFFALASIGELSALRKEYKRES